LKLSLHFFDALLLKEHHLLLGACQKKLNTPRLETDNPRGTGKDLTREIPLSGTRMLLLLLG
jgi:hypothetical protein